MVATRIALLTELGALTGVPQNRRIADCRRCAPPRENEESPEPIEGTEYQGLVIGLRHKEGILEHAVAEDVIKSLTVRDLISACICGHEHKCDDVRGQGFFAQTRRERRAYPTVDP